MHTCDAYCWELLERTLMDTKNRHVITGAPSTGKTTVLEALSNEHQVFPEIARQVIQEQLAQASNKLPWKDNLTFSRLVVQRQIKDFDAHRGRLAFFDRGIPDVMAYLSYYGQSKSITDFMPQIRQYRYAKEVFLMPPWKAIYKKDTERKEDFEQALAINDQIIKSYEALNYKIIQVPFGLPEERVKFILAQLKP